MKSTTSIDQLPLRQFMLGFAKQLPRLVALIKSDEIRNHPRWGALLPYDVSVYGNTPSPGHCVRPDVVMTDTGPIICEIDFVASGRAHLIESLRHLPDAREQVLHGFADWYKDMGADSVLYGTGTRTSCFRETEIFAAAMRDEAGFDIQETNLDEHPDLNGRFIDRLSYVSEMATEDPDRKLLKSSVVTTAEPFLDSKAFAVFVHDSEMEDVIVRRLGKDALAFWRKHVPVTFFLDEITDQAMQIICADPKRWVIKSTDVETDTCWGCRGTIVGSAFRSQQMVKFLRDGKRNGFGKRDPGDKPIVQMLGRSVDFTDMWNRAIRGEAATPDHAAFGREVSDVCTQEAQAPVHGRIGFFLPFTVGGKAHKNASAFAEIVLRQSPIVHGASDAIAVAAELC